MGHRGQNLETGKAAPSTHRGRGGASRKVWSLLGKVQRARRWALLFLRSQETDDQGQKESKTTAGFSTKGTGGWGCHSPIPPNFRSFLCKGRSSIWRTQMVNKERMNVSMHLAKCWGGKALWRPAGGLKEAL